MKLAIMQPYFFPYIGYWQLINAVDRFVIYDDVNYIKGGWINRNQILINGSPSYITLPLNQASAYKRICDLSLQSSKEWRGKLLKTIELTYRKASQFSKVYPIIENAINYKTENLSEYLVHQLKTISAFININTEFVISSSIYKNDHLNGQNRVLDICAQERATTYINPKGGQTLYDFSAFANKGIDLQFIVMNAMPYKQKSEIFTPYLSIIDALMEVPATEFECHLNDFSLIQSD